MDQNWASPVARVLTAGSRYQKSSLPGCSTYRGLISTALGFREHAPRRRCRRQASYLFEHSWDGENFVSTLHQSLLNRRFHGKMFREFRTSVLQFIQWHSIRKKKKQHMSIMSIQSFQNFPSPKKPKKQIEKKIRKISRAKSWGPRAPCSPSASFLRWPFGPPASSPRSWFWGFFSGLWWIMIWYRYIYIYV